MSSENRLTKPQRKWLSEFLATRPHHRYQVYTIDGGTRTIVIEWSEETNTIALDARTYIATKIKHKLVVVLRMSGHPLKDGRYTFDITPPQKYRSNTTLRGQVALDIPQNYAVVFPNNPVLVERKTTKTNGTKSTPTNNSIQQKLTLNAFAQTLQDINNKLTGVVKSIDELLELSRFEDIELPAIFITMLNSKDATRDEFMLAYQIFNSGGIESILNYINSIEQLRKL